jgi:NADPH-dependent ferric siderophore reductase
MHTTAVRRGGDIDAATSYPAAGMNVRSTLRCWKLVVEAKTELTPRMRRIYFTGPELARFKYQPGQALSFQIPLGNGECGRRDFTVRFHDAAAGRMAIDFVRHKHTPASIWADDASPGDTIEARGPRGRVIINPFADWHLFSGDETCIPAIFHMLEALPLNSRAFVWIEVDSDSDELAFHSNAAVTIQWLRRNGRAPGPSEILPECIRAFELPLGSGQAYIIGETNNVRQQRHILLARGMSTQQILAEGYWRPDRVGGNDQIND